MLGLLAGCQQVKVDRWVEKPCQPHGFYVAFAGESLADVAKICQVDEASLIKHNTWLTSRQPFKEYTVVWLKPNPYAPPETEQDLQMQAMAVDRPKVDTESLQPLNLPTRQLVKRAK